MAADVPQRRLAEMLGRPAEEFAAFAVLAPAQLDMLVVAVEATAARQREALQRAVDESLQHLPPVLRSTVKAAVGLR
ncbi:hypothetical protein ACQEVB_12840 [Pseudonocardia sp. CA-107938]|uniref:hypothetical protein n=1 Tax=Pseudonocardia sp. CA-107938 TaxID=3240021 RepID=UPI003D8DCE5D